MDREEVEAAKAFLNRIREVQKEIDNLRMERRQVRIGVDSITGIDYSTDRVLASGENKLERAGWKLLERLKVIDSKIEELFDERNQRIDMILKLKYPGQAKILHMYYASMMTEARIADSQGYSVSQVSRLLREAAQAFYDEYLKR